MPFCSVSSRPRAPSAVAIRPKPTLRRMQPWLPLLPQEALSAVWRKGLPKIWTRADFAAHGAALARAIVKAARTTQAAAFGEIAKRARQVFEQQVGMIISKVMRAVEKEAVPGDVKADPLALMPSNIGALWMQAIEEVMEETKTDLPTKLMPPLKAVMERGYGLTADMIGVHPDYNARDRIDYNVGVIAKRVTKINDTTRSVIRSSVATSLDVGITVKETTDDLRKVLARFAEYRTRMIARTETNMAWTAGSVAAFQQCDTVTHVSVIGCEAREPGSPTYKGQPTCNIEDVPVEDAHLLDFHPNHTGTIVPSQFRDLVPQVAPEPEPKESDLKDTELFKRFPTELQEYFGRVENQKMIPPAWINMPKDKHPSFKLSDKPYGYFDPTTNTVYWRKETRIDNPSQGEKETARVVIHEMAHWHHIKGEIIPWTKVEDVDKRLVKACSADSKKLYAKMDMLKKRRWNKKDPIYSHPEVAKGRCVELWDIARNVHKTNPHGEYINAAVNSCDIAQCLTGGNVCTDVGHSAEYYNSYPPLRYAEIYAEMAESVLLQFAVDKSLNPAVLYPNLAKTVSKMLGL